MFQFFVFVLNDTNCNKALFKIILPYSELTCQLMRVDKFSTVIRQGVLTGGPYLTVAQTKLNPYLLFSYLIEGLEQLDKETERKVLTKGKSHFMNSNLKP